MPATAAARLKEIRDFALSLPGTQPKSPWPGHDDVAVNDKTFLYLGLHDGADAGQSDASPQTRRSLLHGRASNRVREQHARRAFGLELERLGARRGHQPVECQRWLEIATLVQARRAKDPANRR